MNGSSISEVSWKPEYYTVKIIESRPFDAASKNKMQKQRYGVKVPKLMDQVWSVTFLVLIGLWVIQITSIAKQYRRLGRIIMAGKVEVLAEMDSIKAHLMAIDAGVEELHALIAAQTGDGITPAVADELLAKLAEMRLEADKILTDDPATP